MEPIKMHSFIFTLIANKEKEEKHFHKISTEITVIRSGKVIMFDKEFVSGDIVVANPGEATAFEAKDDSVTVVVKLPSVIGDKFLI
jgi:hypothetical protein